MYGVVCRVCELLCVMYVRCCVSCTVLCVMYVRCVVSGIRAVGSKC